MLDRIQKANYFVIILVSMPSVSYTDHMSFICRYIVIEDKEVEVGEWFLGFIREQGKRADDIKNMILDWQEKEKFNFKNIVGENLTM